MLRYRQVNAMTRAMLASSHWEPEIEEENKAIQSLVECALGLPLQELALYGSRLETHKQDQRQADDESDREQHRVDGDGIAVERLVEEIVQPGLGEVEQPGQADDGA